MSGRTSLTRAATPLASAMTKLVLFIALLIVLMKIALRLLMAILVAVMTFWAAGAIVYSPLSSQGFRIALAGIFVFTTALAFLQLRNRRRTFLCFLVVFAVLVLLYFQIPASNDREWQPEVAIAPYATINGDLVTIHGVRNFDYRTETDFDVRWEDRTYDLSKLDSAHLIAVYWAGKAIPISC